MGEKKGVREKTIRIKYKGEKRTVYEWAKEVGLRPSIIYNRYYAGWSPERIFTEPVKNVNRGTKKEELKTHPIYTFILRYKRSHDGNSPSMNSIAKKMDYTHSHVQYWIQRFTEVGLVHYDGEDNLHVYGGEWVPPSEEEINELLEN